MEKEYKSPEKGGRTEEFEKMDGGSLKKKPELSKDEREKIFEEVDMYLKEADAILNLPDDKSERLKTLLFGIDGKLKRHVNLLSHWSFDFYRPGLSEKEKEIMEEDSEKFNIIQQKREELLEKFKKNE